MNNIINTIFTRSGFKLSERDDSVIFYKKENKEYFIVMYCNKREIENFFQDDKTINLINIFNEKIKIESEDIEKNTSLIICLEIDNLNELNELRNQIYKIEEDEYFFKKYIITYTKSSLKPLSDKIKLKDYVNNSKYFESFKENNLFSESYYLAMQLYVKIPFLSFDPDSVKIKLISNIIEDNLSEENRKIRDTIINKIDNLPSKDQVNKISLDNYFSELSDNIFVEKVNKSTEELFNMF